MKQVRVVTQTRDTHKCPSSSSEHSGATSSGIVSMWVVLVLAVVAFFSPSYASAAIAWGGISAVTNASSITSVAVSGSNTVGFVSVNGDDGASQSVTAITWGGVSMTKIAEVRMPAPASRWMSTWYVVNPSSSATIAFTGGTYWRAFSYYVTGASQSGIPDSSNTGTVGSGTSIGVATTVVAPNSWLFLMKADGAGGRTDTPSNAVTTARLSADAGGLALLDSNGVVGTGSQTATDSISGTATQLAGLAFSVAPAAAAAVPTNIGSWINSGSIIINGGSWIKQQ